MKGKFMIKYDHVIILFIFAIIAGATMFLLLLMTPVDCTPQIQQALLGCLCPQK